MLPGARSYRAKVRACIQLHSRSTRSWQARSALQRIVKANHERAAPISCAGFGRIFPETPNYLLKRSVVT